MKRVLELELQDLVLGKNSKVRIEHAGTRGRRKSTTGEMMRPLAASLVHFVQ